MSLVKNLRRREVEIFGAKRIIRNDVKETKTEEKPKAKNIKKGSKRTTKKVEVE